MFVLWLELPHVLVGGLCIVLAHLTQYLLEVRLRGGGGGRGRGRGGGRGGEGRGGKDKDFVPWYNYNYVYNSLALRGLLYTLTGGCLVFCTKSRML